MKEMVQDHKSTVVCLQETKLVLVDDGIICETLGPQFLGNYAAILAGGVRGGVIIACSQDHYDLENIDVRQYAVSATIKRKSDLTTWSFTEVCGPQGDQEKLVFLEEIRAVKQQVQAKPARRLQPDLQGE